MEVPFLDLRAQWAAVGEEVMAALEPVYADARYIMGPAVECFEREMEAYIGCRHAVGCGSGTDALLLGMLALGIGPGDEVIVPAFTFYATAAPAARLGAGPVFADVDPATLCITASEIERRLTARTKLVVPVHQYGRPADMGAIVELCGARGVEVLEDAAQAIGSRYGGRRVGTTGGAAACFSFFPSKNLGAPGDGGMLVTDDDELATRVRLLRSHGCERRYYHDALGLNSRLDSVHAAALSVKLRRLDDWSAARAENAAYYNERFGDARNIVTPEVATNGVPNWHLYTVRLPRSRRNGIRAQLAERGIGTETYWPVPLHLQECFAHLGGKPGDLPVSEALAGEVLSLPVYPELSERQREHVAEALLELAG